MIGHIIGLCMLALIVIGILQSDHHKPRKRDPRVEHMRKIHRRMEKRRAKQETRKETAQLGLGL